MARKSDGFIGIRVANQIKEKWEKRAEQEHRSLSNWIIYRLLEEDKRPTHDGHDRRKTA